MESFCLCGVLRRDRVPGETLQVAAGHAEGVGDLLQVGNGGSNLAAAPAGNLYVGDADLACHLGLRQTTCAHGGVQPYSQTVLRTHRSPRSPRPASRARTIASARSATCSLPKIFETWLRTVFSL